MNKTINGISYVTVPEIEHGECVECVADEETWLCEALEVNDHCTAVETIWKKESEMKNVMNLIDMTAKNMLKHDLQDCVKAIMSIKNVDVAISMALDDIENDTVRAFIEERMYDVEDYLKKEFLDEKIKIDCESIIEKFPVNLVYYDGFPLIYDQLKELLVNELRDAVVENYYNELEKLYLQDLYEILSENCSESVENMVAMAIKQVDEETMTNMINGSLEEDVKSYLSVIN